jgi:hypothetical protein
MFTRSVERCVPSVRQLRFEQSVCAGADLLKLGSGKETYLLERDSSSACPQTNTME